MCAVRRCSPHLSVYPILLARPAFLQPVIVWRRVFGCQCCARVDAIVTATKFVTGPRFFCFRFLFNIPSMPAYAFRLVCIKYPFPRFLASASSSSRLGSHCSLKAQNSAIGHSQYQIERACGLMTCMQCFVTCSRCLQIKHR